MSKRLAGRLGLLLCAALVATAAPAHALADDEAQGFERTPPRLSFTEGEVSFWRSGAEDWTPARVNTALAAGDELYTGGEANLELQVGPRAFVRAGEDTQLGLLSLEPDYLELRLTEGTVSLDLRSLKAGQTLELGTPNAAFRVERSGYYRVEVDGDTTTFTSRRGGRATVTPAVGDPAVIAASEQVVVTGSDEPQLESYAAPELDAWDRWNYARTDDQLDSVSARYVPADVYGAYDLDPYGVWRVVPTYGAVWVPHHVGVGWVPYSTGRWMWDPWYGWTWVDDAVWGWAPFHYGRWVYVSGYWGWCPGPLVVRPYYAPALVAFYGGGIHLGVPIRRPHVGWVALGWGEPLIPWWGPSQFRRHAHWAGWGGPRVVNHVAVKRHAVVDASEINLYENAGVRDAIVEVDRDRFGRRGGDAVPFGRAKAGRLSPLQSRMDVGPDRSSLVAEARAARRPPEAVQTRAVVRPQARPPREITIRPPFGTRSEVERVTPLPAPRYQGPAVGSPDAAPHLPSLRERHGVEMRRGAPVVRQPSAAPALPGEPANRVYRWERPGSVLPRQHGPALREPKAERPVTEPPSGTGRPGGGFDPRGRSLGR